MERGEIDQWDAKEIMFRAGVLLIAGADRFPVSLSGLAGTAEALLGDLQIRVSIAVDTEANQFVLHTLDFGKSRAEPEELKLGLADGGVTFVVRVRESQFSSLLTPDGRLVDFAVNQIVQLPPGGGDR
jgi:hypothetical protein